LERAGLLSRNKLNRPTAILRRGKKDTEPPEEKRAARLQREMAKPNENPHLRPLADWKGERPPPC